MKDELAEWLTRLHGARCPDDVRALVDELLAWYDREPRIELLALFEVVAVHDYVALEVLVRELFESAPWPQRWSLQWDCPDDSRRRDIAVARLVRLGALAVGPLLRALAQPERTSRVLEVFAAMGHQLAIYSEVLGATAELHATLRSLAATRATHGQLAIVLACLTSEVS